MKKLKLPTFKKPLPSAKKLSMDDYLKFVYINLKYVRGRKRAKKTSPVSQPFVLK